MAIGFKHGSFGGTPLNLEVVGGTSAPTAPKENMIWVNTDTAITGWHFSEDEPSATAGTVWIATGAKKDIAFNALKQNSLMVYPSAVKVYSGTKFNYRNASIYQNGKWKQFSSEWDGTLFDNGDQHESFTGGWVNASGSTLSASFFSSQTFSAPVHTEKMIDLTHFNTLHVEFTEVTNAAQFGVTKTRDLTLGSQYATSKTASVGILSLDVSSLNGEYYVTLVAGAATSENCAFTATKVWLE